MADSPKEVHLEAYPEIPVLTLSDFSLKEILGVDPIIENPQDGSLLVLIPGGKFLAGGLRSDEGGEIFEVELPTFYAGLTTVTNAQYARFLNEVKPNKTDLEKWIRLDSDCFVRAKSGGGYEAYGNNEKHPVVSVSWYGAEAYCKWASGRLPSELEWEKASRFTDGREFPWGKDWDKSLCRNAENKGTETTSQVLGYPKGVSPCVLYQVSGNVWEWCQDWYDEEAYKRYKAGNLKSPSSDIIGYIVLRGGSEYIDYEDGFRCAHCYGDDPTSRGYGFRLFRSLTP